MSLGEGSQRDSIGKKINDINTQLKALDSSIGNHQRNVGNYKEAFVGAFQSMGGSVKGMIPPVNTLDKSLKGLAKNPAMLIIGALAAAIGGLVKGFKSSEENMNKLKTAFSGFAAVGDVVTKIFQKLAEWIGNASVALVNFLDKLGLLGPKFKERQRLAEENIKLIQKERDQIVKRAQVEKDAADLRAKAAEEDKYTYQERISFLEQAKEKELANLNVEKEILAAKIAQLSAITEMNGATTERLNQLAELNAEMLRIESSISNTTRQYTKEVNNLKKQAVAAKRQETETLLALQKDLIQQELDLEKQGSDRQLQLAKELREKEYQIEKAGFETKFKNKEQRRKAEKLALQKYNADIEKLEREHQQTLFQIQLQKQDDIFDAQIARASSNYEALKKTYQKAENDYKETITNKTWDATASTESIQKEIAVMYKNVRDSYLNMINEFLNYSEQEVGRKASEEFRVFGEQTVNYYRIMTEGYKAAIESAITEYENFPPMKLVGEKEDEYNQFVENSKEAHEKRLNELKKRYFENWYAYAKRMAKEEDDMILSQMTNNLKDYAARMPHTVFDYIFGEPEESMDKMYRALELIQNKANTIMPEIESMMEELWNKAYPNADKEFDLEEDFFNAFELLPDELKDEYLTALTDLKDAEKEILEQRYENWNGLVSGVGDLFGNLADIYEEDIKRRQKKGKIDEQQAKKEFENIKALQIAQAVINTLAGSVGAFLQASQTYPAP